MHYPQVWLNVAARHCILPRHNLFMDGLIFITRIAVLPRGPGMTFLRRTGELGVHRGTALSPDPRPLINGVHINSCLGKRLEVWQGTRARPDA